MFGITLLLFFGTGIVIAPLAERLGPRRLVAIGAVLLPLGLVLTSRVDTIVAGYVTYGMGVGLGGSLVIAPLFTMASGWIVRRRALALGVLATGNGLGTLLLVPLAERLISDNGWRDAYVWLALIDLVVITAVCVVVRRPPVPPAPPAVTWMKRVATTVTFAGCSPDETLTFSVALYVAFGFIVDFATEAGVELWRRRPVGRDHRCIQHRRAARADHRLRSSRSGPTCCRAAWRCSPWRSCCGSSPAAPTRCSSCSPCCSASATAGSWRSAPRSRSATSGSSA